jgi:hypothetical protein
MYKYMYVSVYTYTYMYVDTLEYVIMGITPTLYFLGNGRNRLDLNGIPALQLHLAKPHSEMIIIMIMMMIIMIKILMMMVIIMIISIF